LAFWNYSLEKKMLIERIMQSFRRLQWKLTLSYTAVTVGTLLTAILILVLLLFSTILAPHEFVPPEFWVKLLIERVPPFWRYVLEQSPVDTKLVSLMLGEGFGERREFQVSFIDLLRVGDLQLTARMMGHWRTLIVDPDGVLLGTSNYDWIYQEAIGQPLDFSVLPGLEVPLKAALAGETDPERLFVNIIPYEKFYFAIPIFSDSVEDQRVLAVAVIYIESLPTESDLAKNTLTLVTRSLLIFVLAAGLIGTLFGALTARGMVRRLERVSQVTDAWSQGDFSEFIGDSVGDEISQLAVRLNNMAEQLKHFLKRSQEMAVSEERNRLARDLHDSAKQEALAASFHLGTALTLFERDPESAKSHLIEAEGLVDSVRGELTDLIHELRPPSMNGTRFDETLNEYIIEWAHQTGIRANLRTEGFVDLSLDIKQALYRIMQEALANVARHSSAEKVEVVLDFGDKSVQFSICDDGSGFDANQQYGGMGLTSMRERAESLAGSFKIESEAGKGTKIVVMFPIT
jgi:NarL family two-component system sensor histidine kinase LiaS